LKTRKKYVHIPEPLQVLIGSARMCAHLHAHKSSRESARAQGAYEDFQFNHPK